jgi:YspA, cpYpsA-related SLOG family
MRILVTGSRNWDDKPGNWGFQPGIVAGVLRMLKDELQIPDGETVVLVHGNCRDSPDRIADMAARRLGWEVESHSAQWERYGKQAGFIRNQEMVDLGADLCLAFLTPCVKDGCPEPKPHDSHGASHCAGLAERSGIHTWRYYQ